MEKMDDVSIFVRRKMDDASWTVADEEQCIASTPLVMTLTGERVDTAFPGLAGC